MVLAERISAIYHGSGDGNALVEAFRQSVVLVPLGDADLPLSGTWGGIRWIYAFSSEAELAAFAAARGEADRSWDYATFRGWRLLDVVVAEVGGPAGVALDVAGPRPMMFPPVTGIVPAPVAVDAGAVSHG
ncbi:hypothetical protein GTS_54740 [Gandjariella thermophila]|uniref:SseB protein N-terminal domain-containing protein n=2 Tax=Gandjariella thermophila TaxID=1931992 RepID=A0A4D4JB08_9PSEU|nr:hypothetical protein GTS_54740 [Gandjariella thermophila]